MTTIRRPSCCCTRGAAPSGLGEGVDRLPIRIVPPTQARRRVSPVAPLND
jgi:hypothetical protein